MVDGFALGPLASGDRLGLEVRAVGQTLPGTDLDGGDAALMPEYLEKLTARPRFAVLLRAAVGDCGAERDERDGVHGFRVLAAAVRLGGAGVEPGQHRSSIRLSRNLPDGDLSGLQLSYEETRQNCIALDSTWYPTVDWPYLRVWTETSGTEPYKVPLRDHATPVEGSYQGGVGGVRTAGRGDGGRLRGTGVAATSTYTYMMYGSDTLENAALGLANAINARWAGR